MPLSLQHDGIQKCRSCTEVMRLSFSVGNGLNRGCASHSAEYSVVGCSVSR